ncbi:MAG: hypothetical protein AAF645_00620 [Myxococcota bacterium]
MRVGVNLPWWDCGHDFGPHPEPWDDGEARDWTARARSLRRAVGPTVQTVRLWILGGGVNLPEGPSGSPEVHEGPLEGALAVPLPRIVRRGLLRWGGWSNEQLRARALRPLSAAFLQDFRACLKAFRNEGFRLMPVLTSFEFFQPVEWQGELASGGRSALVFGDGGRERAQIDRFLDATLSPLLDVAKELPDAVAAFDLVNEPDWATRGGPLHVRVDAEGYRILPKGVEASAMSAFLLEGVSRIAGAGLRATVGFKVPDPGWIDARLRRQLIRLGARGEYVHQLHHYPSAYEWGRLRPHRSLPIQPCIVGEMPTMQGHPFGLHIGIWRERWDVFQALRGERYLGRRLAICADLGYPEALLWSVHSQDVASDRSAIRGAAERFACRPPH